MCDCQLPLLVSGTLNKDRRLAAPRPGRLSGPRNAPHHLRPGGTWAHIPWATHPPAARARTARHSAPRPRPTPQAHTLAITRRRSLPSLPSSFGWFLTPNTTRSSTIIHSSPHSTNTPAPQASSVADDRRRSARPRPRTARRRSRRRSLTCPSHPRRKARRVTLATSHASSGRGYCNIGRIPIIDVNASAPAPAPKPALVAIIYPVSTTPPSPPLITASQSVFIDAAHHHRPPSRRQRAHTLAPTPP